MKIKFTLNGKSTVEELHPGLTLLEYLRRNDQFGVKYGCDHGECGACTVIIDDKSYNACLVLLHTLDNKSVETIESLEKPGKLHPLQTRFIDEGAIQCGYCSPGMILSAAALLRENANPEDSEIKSALAGNLCRCTGYVKPLKAIKP
jgi:carbon-monoxide dehydrogenase small subunit